MKHTLYYHRHSDQIVKSDLKYKEDYDELISVINSISDKDLINAFNFRKQERPNIKSLSEPINQILKDKLLELSWNSESAIFYDKVYKTNRKWRLDFVKNEIALEVAFNHSTVISHNIMKTVLSSELNHVKKEIQTSLGVIICATSVLKKIGNFDGAIGTFENFIEYFKPYQSIVPTPMVLIGLDAPKSFYIDEKTKEITFKNQTGLF